MQQGQQKGGLASYKDKDFALSLLHSSLKTYRLLQCVFDLLSVTILRKVVRNISVYSGFNNNILQALEKKLSNATESSKVMAVAIDEMFIKEGLTYDRHKDAMEGFSEGSSQLASHAIAFMVRGITEKWKQPIGYFLSSGPMSGKDMKKLLFECIKKLHDIGVRVLVTVGGKGSNNRHLFETDLGITVNHPYFMDGTNIVFVMYDPPHLIKNVRNKLKKHGLTIKTKKIL